MEGGWAAAIGYKNLRMTGKVAKREKGDRGGSATAIPSLWSDLVTENGGGEL